MDFSVSSSLGAIKEPDIRCDRGIIMRGIRLVPIVCVLLLICVSFTSGFSQEPALQMNGATARVDIDDTTALMAKRGKFDYFSTTLLYSKFQNHAMIKSIGESVGQSAGIPFLYEDFRRGWKEGIKKSKDLELYRQKYCGCIYSEKERFNRQSKASRS